MNNKTMQVVALAVLAALVTVFTMFVSIPTGIGYANLGDAVILFGGLLLGPISAVAAGVGSALADLLLGYAVYAPATLIIKGVMGYACGMLLQRGSEKWTRLLVAFLICEAWMVAGYFVFECFIYSVPAAAGSILPNILQGAVGTACALALSPARHGIERALNVKK